MIVGGVGDSDGEGAGGGGSGYGSVRGAGVVVGRCWVASCVDLMLARVSEVFCWVLGLLVLPTVGALRWLLALVRVPLVMYCWVLLPPVSPLAPGVSVGEGVVGGVRFGCCWWRCWCGRRSRWF